MKARALERYTQQMGRLVERHLFEAALIAAREAALDQAARADHARMETERAAAALRVEVAVRERSQEHLAHLAAHDPLTGLPNRTGFSQLLAEATIRAGQDGTGLALLYIDLDNFKDVNDTLGHVVGDDLLQQVARRLQAQTSLQLTVARIGGDEFAILAVGLTGKAAAVELGDRLIADICRPFDVFGRPIFIGASIGVSLLPADAQSVDMLHRHADLALYRAKSDGRNRCHVFDRSLNDEVQRRAMLEQALREPGLISQLHIAFQPQFDLRCNRISGAEVLLRWTHPEYGPISPGEFIPLAEQLGMIIPIGTWVLRESCQQAARWRATGLPPLIISVNVSSVQFRIGNIPDLVAGILAEAGLPGSCLEVEITESAVMNHTADSIGDLHALSAMGVGLAIDDFGTGYSSLSYLRKLPVNRIKIDQSFIRDAIIAEDASMIAKTIVQLAHSLRLEVVAEGVETQAQLDFIQTIGCAYAQGYYFSRPIDAASFARLAHQLALPASRHAPAS